MRIAHIILTSRFAGSERHVIELANEQARDHDVTLILRRASAKSRPDAYANRVGPGVKVVLVGDWFASWHARRLLRKLKPDVAHAHLSSACRALHGLEGLCPRIATLHISYKPGQHASLDGLIAIAPWQMEAIPQPLRQHTTQIDNWTLANLPAADARGRLRAIHGIPEDAWVIGAIGRAEHNKGFDLLIKAFKQAQLPNARLVIVGRGGELDALRKLADERILLTGFVQQPQDWLAAFDCFVSAARDEPFGLVLLEAMEARLPILASASKGARHLADVIGTPLCPVGDVEALAVALRAMAVQRPERHQYPMERFRIDGKRREIEAFYQSEMDRLGRSNFR